MNKNRMAIEAYMPIVLGIAGALGVFPFAIIRFINGQYSAALLDAIILIGLLTISWHIHRTQKVGFASVALAVVAMSGVIATLYLLGPAQIFWLFPVLVGVFFLVQKRAALLMTVTTIFAALPAVYPTMDNLELLTVLIALTVTCALAYAFASLTNDQHDALMQLARKDPLTGAGNRLALEEKLNDAIASHARFSKTSSLLMLDLDHFKKINDEYGHAAGDQILMRITEIINLRIRTTDSIYRIGGEEFVVVVEGQNLADASRLAEQLRTIVEANELAPTGAITISLGVAEFHGDETADEWLQRADSALYEAKNAGRNNTQFAA